MRRGEWRGQGAAASDDGAIDIDRAAPFRFRDGGGRWSRERREQVVIELQPVGDEILEANVPGAVRFHAAVRFGLKRRAGMFGAKILDLQGAVDIAKIADDVVQRIGKTLGTQRDVAAFDILRWRIFLQHQIDAQAAVLAWVAQADRQVVDRAPWLQFRPNFLHAGSERCSQFVFERDVVRFDLHAQRAALGPHDPLAPRDDISAVVASGQLADPPDVVLHADLAFDPFHRIGERGVLEGGASELDFDPAFHRFAGRAAFDPPFHQHFAPGLQRAEEGRGAAFQRAEQGLVDRNSLGCPHGGEAREFGTGPTDVEGHFDRSALHAVSGVGSSQTLAVDLQRTAAIRQRIWKEVGRGREIASIHSSFGPPSLAIVGRGDAGIEFAKQPEPRPCRSPGGRRQFDPRPCQHESANFERGVDLGIGLPANAAPLELEFRRARAPRQSLHLDAVGVGGEIQFQVGKGRWPIRLGPTALVELARDLEYG